MTSVARRYVVRCRSWSTMVRFNTTHLDSMQGNTGPTVPTSNTGPSKFVFCGAALHQPGGLAIVD